MPTPAGKATAPLSSQKLLYQLDVRPSEVSALLGLLALAAVTGLATAVATTAGNTLFLERFGASALPYLYMGNAAVLGLLGVALVRHPQGKRRTALARPVQTALAVGTGLAWLAAWLGPRQWLPAVAGWCEIAAIYAVLQVWNAAGAAWDVRQARRLFGLVGAGLVLGELVGGLAVGPLSRVVAVPQLLLAAALLFGAGLPLLRRIPTHAADAAPPEGEPQVTLTQLVKAKYVRRIVLLFACSVLVWFIIDLHFLRAAEARYSESELAEFLGTFTAFAALANLGVQLLLTGRVLQRGGISAGLLALPLALAAPVAWLLISGQYQVFGLVVAIKATDEVLRGTIFEAATHLLFQALPGFARDAIHRMVSGVVEPVVGGLAGLLLLLLAGEGHAERPLLLLLLLLVPWAIAGVVLRGDYRQTLRLSLGRRLVEPEHLDLSDPAARTLVEKSLDSPDDLQVQASLALLAQHGQELGDAVLERLLMRPSPEVRVAVLTWIAERGLDAWTGRVQPLLQDRDRKVRLAAIKTWCIIDQSEPWATVAPLLDDPDVDVQVAAAAGLVAALGVDGVVAMAPRLRAWAESPSPVERSALARLLGEVAIEKFYRPLLPLLRDAEPSVQRAALTAAGKVGNFALLAEVCRALQKPETQAVAVQTLTRWGAAVIPKLAKHLEQTLPATEVRGVLRAVGRARTLGAHALLARYAHDSREQVRGEALEQLTALPMEPGSALEVGKLDGLLREEVEDAKFSLRLLAVFPRQNQAVLGAPGGLGPPAETAVLRAALEREVAMNKHRLLLLLELRYGKKAIERPAWLLRRSAPGQGGAALEVLEQALSRSDAALVLPVLDVRAAEAPGHDLQALDAATRRSPRAGRAQGDPLTTPQNFDDLSAVVAALLDPKRPLIRDWTRLAALYTAGKLALPRAAELAAPWLCDDDLVMRETAAMAAHGAQGMLLTVEKVLFLKATDLFAGISDEDLVAVAQIAVARGIPAQHPVFAAGDLGDSLYVVVRGQVRIHIGERQLVVLKERQHFGELAVIDPQPRSASATALDDTLLLEIGRAPFMELLERSPEVVRGVLLYLVSKVRALTPK